MLTDTNKNDIEENMVTTNDKVDKKKSKMANAGGDFNSSKTEKHKKAKKETKDKESSKKKKSKKGKYFTLTSL